MQYLVVQTLHFNTVLRPTPIIEQIANSVLRFYTSLQKAHHLKLYVKLPLLSLTVKLATESAHTFYTNISFKIIQRQFLPKTKQRNCLFPSYQQKTRLGGIPEQVSPSAEATLRLNVMTPPSPLRLPSASSHEGVPVYVRHGQRKSKKKSCHSLSGN